jgi:osomolarity two-component system response regulator SSK1
VPSDEPDTNPTNSSPVPIRPRPNLESLILRRLLRRINGTISSDITPRLFTPGRATELSLLVEPGSEDLLVKPPSLSLEEEAARQPFANANIQLATEPSLEELFTFLDTLKGKRVALFASGKGSFAHHMTSYLTAWGLDVSHTTTVDSLAGGVEVSLGDLKERRQSTDTLTSVRMMGLTESPAAMEKADVNPLEDAAQNDGDGDGNNRPAFIMIDDDVNALRRQLTQLLLEAPFNGSSAVKMNLKLNPTIASRRPNLAALHRPKSSPQVARSKLAKSQFQQPLPVPPPVIIHFTSLSNYKLVKDTINSVFSTPPPQSSHSSASAAQMSLYGQGACTIPEVIVIPKPAGPRRLLVALRTALTKPIVDPCFTPIATSPMSPSTGAGFPGGPMSPYSAWGWSHGGNISPSGNPLAGSQRSGGRPPISPRTASDRSHRSGASGISNEHALGFVPAHHRTGLPPSPLGHPDTMEYFSEAAMKLGTSPSSGLVIQSPDGQPAGIFFHPRGSGNRTARGTREFGTSGIQPPPMVRDGGNLRPHGDAYRPSLRRRPTGDAESGPSRPSYARQRSFAHRSTEGVAIHDDTHGATLSAIAAANALAGRPRRGTPRGDERTAVEPAPTPASTVPSSASSVNGSPLEIPPPIPSTFSPRQSATDALSRRTTSPPNVPAQRLTNVHTSGSSPNASPTTAAHTPVSTSPVAAAQVHGASTVQPRRPPRRATDLPSESAKKGKGALDSNIVPPVNVLIVEGECLSEA